MKTIVIAAMLIVGVNDARAEGVSAFFTGNKLWDYCMEPRGSLQFGFCAGHIAGVADAMTSYGGLGRYRACKLDQVQVGQVVEIVIQSLRGNPNTRHLTASSLTAKALAEAFPCR